MRHRPATATGRLATSPTPCHLAFEGAQPVRRASRTACFVRGRQIDSPFTQELLLLLLCTTPSFPHVAATAEHRYAAPLCAPSRLRMAAIRLSPCSASVPCHTASLVKAEGCSVETLQAQLVAKRSYRLQGPSITVHGVYGGAIKSSVCAGGAQLAGGQATSNNHKQL